MNTQPENEKGLTGQEETNNKKSKEELEEGLPEEENTGMDMGTAYKEDREQDLDDLVHSKGSLHKKTDIPPPEES